VRRPAPVPAPWREKPFRVYHDRKDRNATSL
jgi:hypothetical protein